MVFICNKMSIITENHFSSTHNIKISVFVTPNNVINGQVKLLQITIFVSIIIGIL